MPLDSKGSELRRALRRRIQHEAEIDVSIETRLLSRSFKLTDTRSRYRRMHRFDTSLGRSDRIPRFQMSTRKTGRYPRYRADPRAICGENTGQSSGELPLRGRGKERTDGTRF